MKKLGIIFTLLSAILFANNAPLFAEVKGVASNDLLNIRSMPNYHSKKVASIPNEASVGVSRCKEVGDSKWCKIFHLTQLNYNNFDDNTPSGWVNAKFLKFSNRGYVIVNNKASCDYALRCSGNKCKVVTDYSSDKNGNVIKLKISWIKRSRLKAASRFGAMNPKEDGYCTMGMYVENYLKRKKQ